ncbi:hypothetical protein HY250_03290 [Candidatus Azambacteria bacterium]|nr:hypothetical protein [Candidatus Azambacteria bacterium]MBI3685401.1 hypothetical protein [Candidatus Azambacteria bacterium]
MNEATERVLSDAAKKIDILLWVFSIPLLPMILAEFFTSFSSETEIYFKAYYFTLWMVFTGEFVLRVTLAKDKTEHLKENWFDVLVVFTPVFRIFKVLRFMRLPVLLLSDKVLAALGSFGLNFLYYLIFVTVVVLAGADLALFFEQQNPQAAIHTFPQAVWWAMNYVTSSGHAMYDVTTFGGRMVGATLMTLGFAVFSILIASLVSFFMREYSRQTKDDDLLEGIKDQLGVDDIVSRLERIERKLDKK